MPPPLQAALTALALGIVAGAAFVVFDLARRLRTTGPREAAAWLAAAAVALGTGLWAAAVVMLAGEPTTRGFQPGLTGAAWALAVAGSAVGLAWAGSRVITWPRIAVGAAALGITAAVLPLALLAAVSAVPAADAHWLTWAASMPVAAGLGSAALGLFFRERQRFERHAVLCHGVAAAVLGLAAVGAQALAAHAAGSADSAGRVPADSVAPLGMALLAAAGSAALLALLQFGSVRAAQRRTAHRVAKHDLRKLALRDPLTGLTNRVVFDGALNQAVMHADKNKTRLALLYIDLDGFRPVNELLGHRNGDRLLRDAAARLRSVTGPHDRLARLGADEFLILRTCDPGSDAAAHLAGEVLERLSQPFALDGREATLTASIGIAMYPEHGAMSTLVAHADAAMRAAKGSGGATYNFFEARMARDARDQSELLRDLRVALEKGQLELYYQPKIHAPSGEITGVEALMRWHHPQRGLVSPTVFIPLAERYGLIHTLGNWVIDEACRQARAWRDGGLRMRVAINLSVHQLRQTDLVERIGAALARNKVQPQLLTCEITESVAMEDGPATTRFFEALAGIGVHISIDDFGTGYSSLSMLRKLPAKELKIDRSFVLDLEGSADARAVVDAVVKLAQALGLKVVAEGVETEAQNQILRSLGCDELQGFLFAKPMSAKALAVWAMEDDGPRSLLFRASLYRDRDTAPLAMH